MPVPKKGMSATLYLMSVLLAFACQHCLQALQKDSLHMGPSTYICVSIELMSFGAGDSAHNPTCSLMRMRLSMGRLRLH